MVDNRAHCRPADFGNQGLVLTVLIFKTRSQISWHRCEDYYGVPRPVLSAEQMAEVRIGGGPG